MRRFLNALRRFFAPDLPPGWVEAWFTWGKPAYVAHMVLAALKGIGVGLVLVIVFSIVTTRPTERPERDPWSFDLPLVAVVGAEPGTWNPVSRQGETFTRVVTWCTGPTTAACVAGTGTYVNVTGYSAKLQLRDTVSNTVVDEWTEADGLVLGGVAGTITWTMTATETAALPVGSLVYDLRLTSGTSVVTYLLAGHVAVQKRITQ